MVKKFFDGFTVQMQSILAVMFSATSCWLWVTKGTVPQDLLLINGIVVAFYFGQKAVGSNVPAEPALPKPYVPGDGS